MTMATIGYQAYGTLNIVRSVVQPGSDRGLQECITLLRNVLDRRHQRRALRHLDDHLLRDIGISRQEALKEARKPFWR
jgi:uncharacterized protein YjiS (DUF1127 family)